MITSVKSNRFWHIGLFAGVLLAIYLLNASELAVFFLPDKDKVKYYLENNRLSDAVRVVEAIPFDTTTASKNDIKRFHEIQKHLSEAKLQQKSNLLAERGILRLDSGMWMHNAVGLMDIDMALKIAPESSRAHSAKARYFTELQIAVTGKPGGAEFTNCEEELTKAIELSDNNRCDLLILRAMNSLDQAYYISPWHVSDEVRASTEIKYRAEADKDLHLALAQADKKPDKWKEMYKAEIFFLLKDDKNYTEQLDIALAKGCTIETFMNEFQKNTLHPNVHPFNLRFRQRLR